MSPDVTEPAIPFADDPDAWRRHDGFVRRLAGHLLGDGAEADDLAQQVWVKALRGGPRVSGAWMAWLRRVVVRLAHRQVRGDRRRRVHEGRVVSAPASPTPDEIRAREEMRQLVIDAVLSLREPYRGTVVLHYLEECSAREIAQRQGVPLETVRTRLKRALELLRAALRLRCGDEWRGALALVPLARRASWSLVPSGAWIVMQHKVKVAVAAMVAAALLVWWSLGPMSATGPSALPAAPAMATSGAVLSAPAGEVGVAAARVPAAPAAGTATGSLRVQVTWHDGSPAAGVTVEIDPYETRMRELAWQVGRTDAAGEVRFADLPPGKAEVRVPGRSGSSITAVISAGTSSEGRVQLQAGFAVRGRVVDERGDPVVDAAIYVERGDFRFGMEVDRSDGEGHFFLRDLRFAYVGARRPGYAPSGSHVVRGPAHAVLELRLVLTRDGGTVEGTVLAPDGRPAAGALVIVGERQWFGSTQPEGGMAKRAPPVRVTSDSEGDFLVDGVAAGQLPVCVSHPAGAPWFGEVEAAAGASTSLIVTLQAAGTVVGTARGEDGEPLPETWVRLASRSEPRNPGPYFDRGASVAADGSFRLMHLPVGEVVLRAGHADHAPLDVTLSVGPGQLVRWDPRLTRGRTVRGRLVDETGAPVSGVHVEAHAIGQTSSMYGVDLDGRFAIPRVVADRFDVFTVVRSNPLERVRVEDVRIPDGELTVTVPARPKGRATIRGRIVDAAGKPVVHADIHVLGWQGNIEPPDADGTFTRTCTPGVYAIRVSATGFGTLSVDLRVVRAGDTWDVGELRLDAAAQLVVHASLSPGLRWPAAERRHDGASHVPIQARLVDTAGRVRAWGSMPEPGRIEFGALAAGRYRVLVLGDEFASEPVEVVVEAGAARETVVTLVRGVRHDLRATFGTRRPGWPEVELLDAQGAPLVRLGLAVQADGVATVSCRLATDQCTARVWVDGEPAPEIAVEHAIVR